MFSIVGFSQTFPGGTGAIPDNNCDATNEFTVVVSGIGVLGGTNSFDEAVLNITHTWDSDLDITLIAPDMTAVILSDDNGGSADNYTDTHFRADASTDITVGVAPFTGNFLPEQNLSAFDGVNADGTWILRVCDDAGGDTGTVDSWNLTFALTPACPDPTLSIGNFVAPNFADISLGAATGATGYNWEIQPQGTAQGTASALDSGSTALIDFTATNLVDGTDYTLYVQSDCGGALGNWISTDFSFNLPPGNDDCTNVIALTVNTDYSCGTVTAGTTLFATASAQADDVTGTPNTDVWYSFVATGTDHRVSLTNIVNQGGGTSTSTDMGMGVYDATGGCAALVLFGDSDPNTLNLTGLVPVTTYYVRVYGWSSTIQNNNFDICVGTPPAAPENDNLCNAIPLTIDVAGVTGSYTNDSATEETSEPAGACFNGGAQGTVWFSFVAPASGEVQVSTDIGGTLTDSEIAVYEATGVSCGDLTTLPAALGCDQDSGTVVNFNSILDLTVVNTNAVTPGVTYYVQVSGYNDSRGSFGVQVFDQLTLSVDDLVLTKGFKYYPNPVKERLTVSAKNEIKQLSIVNMLGQTIRTVTPNSRNYQLDFSDLTSGIYFVKATVNNTEGIFRIVKK